MIVVSFTEIDKHLYYHPPTAVTVFNMQQIMRNAGNIGEMGNNQAFVLVLTWVIFTLVSLWVVISFTGHRHLLLLSLTNGKVRPKQIKYDNFWIKVDEITMQQGWKPKNSTPWHCDEYKII